MIDDDDDCEEFGEDRPGGLDEDHGGCVLGERCCCPHPYHSAAECFDAEWAEQYFADAQTTKIDEHVPQPLLTVVGGI